MSEPERNHTNLVAYERIARDYAGEVDEEDDPAMRRAVRSLFLERLPGPRVLEIGCGPGKDSRALHEAGCSVLATDFSERFVTIVRERYPDIEARVMDMTAPDLPDGSFDGVYGFATFVHLPRSSAATTLAGLRRLLRPGGLLFLALISSTTHREYVIEDWGGVPGNEMLFTCWDEQEISDLLRVVGFARTELFRVSSPVYDRMPRLAQRGVSLFQVAATRD